MSKLELFPNLYEYVNKIINDWMIRAFSLQISISKTQIKLLLPLYPQDPYPSLAFK